MMGACCLDGGELGVGGPGPSPLVVQPSEEASPPSFRFTLSDGPDRKPDTATFARRELDKIRTLNLSDEDKENLLGQTILKVLHAT